jgi:hypothetical protein
VEDVIDETLCGKVQVKRAKPLNKREWAGFTQEVDRGELNRKLAGAYPIGRSWIT